tara:strand:+ start:233 stop:505 length:273 start_codon:yes stop_codon:yes gene_type:complete
VVKSQDKEDVLSKALTISSIQGQLALKSILREKGSQPITSKEAMISNHQSMDIITRCLLKELSEETTPELEEIHSRMRVHKVDLKMEVSS